ncbi:hypothetical protein TrLO_g1315 [Triparma laevis f. longispina]|uniref:Uncharacterized protein n=1 Tax=Triparma laevis f. longispina TaxID=1714387 RepID=A0A9W7FS77_9STRA|nr:hypothetical protein TrLO_g1315 [Triparma laevis f. longispina]
MVLCSLLNLYYIDPYDLSDPEKPLSFKIALVLDFIIAMTFHYVSRKQKLYMEEKEEAERRKRENILSSLSLAAAQAERDTADKENWNVMQAEARLEPQSKLNEIERKILSSSAQKKTQAMKSKSKQSILKKRLFKNSKPHSQGNKILQQPSK